MYMIVEIRSHNVTTALQVPNTKLGTINWEVQIHEITKEDLTGKHSLDFK